jgi:nitrogen fixation NifU-like protein
VSHFYADRVIRYFREARHAGEMPDADGVGQVGDIFCGDILVIYVRVREDRVAQISYQVFGCPAAIATCEAVAEMAVGKTVEEAQSITDEQVATFLGGLPDLKLHCSNSAALALDRALSDYADRRAVSGGKEHPSANL